MELHSHQYYYNWHYLASIWVEAQLLWLVHLSSCQIVRVCGHYRAAHDPLEHIAIMIAGSIDGPACDIYRGGRPLRFDHGDEPRTEA